MPTYPPIRLSYSQRIALEAMLKPGSRYETRGCTNSTLNALRKRGLVDLKFVPAEYYPSVKIEKWTITAAGRELVQ